MQSQFYLPNSSMRHSAVCLLVGRHHVNMTWRLATLETWKMFRFMTFLFTVENNISLQCLPISICVLISISSVQPGLSDSQPEAQNIEGQRSVFHQLPKIQNTTFQVKDQLHKIYETTFGGLPSCPSAAAGQIKSNQQFDNFPCFNFQIFLLYIFFNIENKIWVVAFLHFYCSWSHERMCELTNQIQFKHFACFNFLAIIIVLKYIKPHLVGSLLALLLPLVKIKNQN